MFGNTIKFRRDRMIRKVLILALGLSLAAVSFCKKEEPVVEEKMETVEDAAKAVNKEVDAAAKKAEAEAKKAIDAGTKAATGAVKDAVKEIPKTPGL